MFRFSILKMLPIAILFLISTQALAHVVRYPHTHEHTHGEFFNRHTHSNTESNHLTRDIWERELEVSSKVNQTKGISKRMGQVTYSNCNTAPPIGSFRGTGKNDPRNKLFPTKQSVLQRAYAGAVELASQAENVSPSNQGFTHYFGGANADLQYTHFTNMMKAITSSDINYSIKFECLNTPTCGADSIMVTDATSGTANDVKTIEVCAKFWTGLSTAYLLYDHSNTAPSPPFRNNDATDAGWCKKLVGRREPKDTSWNGVNFFATAANSILHELTHLDNLGRLAGLNPDPECRYGTLDIMDDFDMRELKGARNYLSSYKSGSKNKESPDYNAESYAAAATEIYFMGLCGFEDIPLNNGGDK